MKNKLAISILLAAALLSLSIAVSASAPSGLPPKNAVEALQQADLVFTGRVLATTKDRLGFDSLSTIVIEKIYKGEQLLGSRKMVQISGEGGPTYPARIFLVGQKFLFYINKDMHADSFTNRVLELKTSAEDLKILDNILKNGPLTTQTLSFDGTPIRELRAQGFWQSERLEATDKCVGAAYSNDQSKCKLSVLLFSDPIPDSLKILLRSTPHVLDANEKNTLEQKSNPWIVRYVGERGEPRIDLLAGRPVLYDAFSQGKLIAAATSRGEVCLPATSYEVHAFMLAGNSLMEISFVKNLNGPEEMNQLAAVEKEFKKITSLIKGLSI